MIIPGVLNGSKGSLFYPADEIIRSVDAWNGMPITLGHPTENGSPVSARKPHVIDKFGIGTVYSANYDGKLSAEAWIDVDACRRKAPDVLNAIKASKPVELSTGLFTDDEVAPQGSVYNGVNGQKSFDYVARNYRPDHLAILTDQKGACSLRDGCGLGVNSNPEGINQYTGGGGSSEPKEHEGGNLQVDYHKDRSPILPDATASALSDSGLAATADNAGATVKAGLGKISKVMKEKGWSHELSQHKDGKQIHAYSKGAYRATFEEESATRTGALITKNSSEKYKNLASEHMEAAREIKSRGESPGTRNSRFDEIEATLNAFLPNQPRSQVTGKIKLPNAGTGKGPVHEAAQDGFFGGKCPECGATLGNATNGKCQACEAKHAKALEAVEEVIESVTNQGDQDMDRTKATAFLVTNCDCWKGKEKVLQNKELFDDASVIALAKNAARGMQNEVVVNALTTKLGDKCPTLNEMPAFIKDKIAAKDEKKVDPEEEEVDGEEELALLAHSKKKATANKGKPMTVEEYLADPRIPAPIRNAHRHAIKIEEREKQVVVNKLTSAISDPERKAERKKRLMTLELNELYDRLGDVAEVVMNHDSEDEVPLPRYGSGDVIFPNSQTNNESEAETLDLPTMNWAKKTGAAA